MRTTTIQIARILRDALEPDDLARLAEAIEGYLIDGDAPGGREVHLAPILDDPAGAPERRVDLHAG